MSWLTLASLLICLHAAAPAAPVLGPPTGLAFHYRPGLMAQVAHRRGMALAGAVAGYASTPSCGRVDPARPWWVRVAWPDGTQEWLQVVDCSDPAHRAAQARRRLVLEVDAATARRHAFEYNYRTGQGAGKGPVWILGYRQP